MKCKNYSELIAWQKAMNSVESVYDLTNNFPREEIYCLTAQLRRAAISIPSNIAEGQGRWSTRDFIRFLSVANGSLRETETQICLALRLGYCPREGARKVMAQAAEVGRLINGLARALQKSPDVR